MSIVMCMQNFIKIYQKVQEIGPVSHFSEFEPRKNLDQSQMIFHNLLGYILSISRSVQNFITIFHSVQEIGPFSLFQNVELGTASTDDNCHFAISWARSCQYQCVCKSVSNIPKGLRVIDIFRVFLLGVMMNGIWQSVCLDLVNIICMQNLIKIYQRVQEIGLGSLSSEFEPRQNLDQSQMAFDNLLGYILSMSRSM